MDLVRVEKEGLYCEAGDFFIDPWRPVSRALITHAHSDHARFGSKTYYCSQSCTPLLRLRLGDDIAVRAMSWSEKIKLGRCWVSFHPAGHILGSAQIRIEEGSKVWVMSGDYKRTFDPSCDAFEVVPCDTFVSEATFALPVYKWDQGAVTVEKIFRWWQQDLERPTMLFCYALGKAQRILTELGALTNQTVYIHGALERITQAYRDYGIPMPPTRVITDKEKGMDFKGQLILAPPSAHRSPWMKRFKEPQTAFASGWMQVRGTRRRKGYEKGFVLSDHADWNELNQTIHETGATTIFLTHGRTDVLARYLQDQGKVVKFFSTEFEDQGEPAA